MRINKISKIITIIIIIITSLIINIEKGYAGVLPSISIGSSGENGNGETDLPKKELKDDDPKKIDGKYYAWSYNYQILGSSNFTVDAYDVDGDSVMPVGITIDESKYTYHSGTWLGINVTKINITSWSVTNFVFKEVKTKYTCNYKREKSTYECGNYKTIENVSQETCLTYNSPSFTPYTNSEDSKGDCRYYKNQTCTVSADEKSYDVEVAYGASNPCNKNNYPGYPAYKYTGATSKKEYENSSNSSAGAKLKTDAVNKIYNDALELNLAKSGIVKYKPDNGGDPIELRNGKKSYDYDSGPSENAGGGYGTIRKEYEFLEENVCINVKTSKVEYGRSCNDDELRVKNGTKTIDGKTIRYWHYFSPLNAKTGYEQELIVKEQLNSKEYPKNDCIDFIKRNPNDYQNHILGIKKEGNNKVEVSLIGDYYKEPKSNLRKNGNSIDSGNIEKGCRLATTIKFPVTQKFYNEVKDNNGNIKFNGFNFYYKPIDINNPFPNGLASTSIWNEWKDKGKTNPNLSQSFKNKTYTTTINANKVREYNDEQKNPYTSWIKMHKNGESTFIKEQGIVTRTSNVNNFYKLGCGPFNETWEGCGSS